MFSDTEQHTFLNKSQAQVTCSFNKSMVGNGTYHKRKLQQAWWLYLKDKNDPVTYRHEGWILAKFNFKSS